MPDWTWLERDDVLAMHEQLLAQLGGLGGIRDLGALESALARPQHLAAYGEPDAADLAAAYLFGIAKNHAFADGNKRTAWAAARTFLILHGTELRFEQEEAFALVIDVASGAADEAAAATWFRERLGFSQEN
jgi:death-on-curing protein